MMYTKLLNCPHFSLCSGCTFSSIPPFPSLYQQARLFILDRAGIEMSLEVGDVSQWRMRAKLAVRRANDNNSVRIGLFERGTHKVLDIPQCAVHHPRINDAVEKIRQFCSRKKIVAYDEWSHVGDLRYIQCVVERKSNLVQLSFVINSLNSCIRKTDQWRIWAQELYQEDVSLWHSMWLNFQPEKTNTIFGSNWERVCGQEWIWEDLLGKKIALGASHFSQSNATMFEKLLFQISQWVPPQKKLLELYAGVGTIGICLLDYFQRVDCVEIYSAVLPCFKASQNALQAWEKEKIEMHIMDAVQAVKLIQKSQICIVDPPRKGLQKQVLQVISLAPDLKQLIYISCGWPAFERDCAILLSQGWIIDRAKAFLFFPGSDHIETAVNFVRS